MKVDAHHWWHALVTADGKVDVCAPRVACALMLIEKQAVCVWGAGSASNTLKESARNDLQVLWISVKVGTPMAQTISSTDAWEVYNDWKDYFEEINEDLPVATGEVSHTCEVWVRMITEREAIQGTQAAIVIATVCAVVAIFLFTGNVTLSLLTLVNLLAIVLSQLAIFQWMGWSLGAVEAISITILVGLSCDFCLHIAEGYCQSPYPSREDRTKDSIRRVGSPICSAAFTTMLGVIPMLFCTIQILVKFGAIIPINMVLSMFLGLLLFAPLVMLMGPAGHLRGMFRSLPGVFLGSIGRRIMSTMSAVLFLMLLIPTAREELFAVDIAITLPMIFIGYALNVALLVWEHYQPPPEPLYINFSDMSTGSFYVGNDIVPTP
ncbi:Patched domain-containing protein [Cymbomonas tetramitiformis]|uniref:Patched domain-containing protein n=1 Tax=Cymbomonas tetramitiformis TaxID=36881 RepID=A0AAE0BIW9_9CHLO|nr:Patched domain-containing protein [Cymbomonas tetramitiformis]